MNRWLAEESKWAREQARKARNEAERLADPEWWRRHSYAVYEAERQLRALVEKHIAAVTELEFLRDDTNRQERIDQLNRDADHWERLAVEQSARLEQTEAGQDALLPDP